MKYRGEQLKRRRVKDRQTKDRQAKDRDDGRDRRVFATRPIAEPAIHRLAAMVRVDLWNDET